MTKKKELTKEDIQTWENYTRNPDDLYDKDKDIVQSKDSRFRYKYDLHGHSLDAANQKVREIILSCVKKNYREILLITGKGLHSNSGNDTYVSKDLSKLKYSVPNFIKTEEELKKLIYSISEANKQDGGEGAIVIKLKKL